LSPKPQEFPIGLQKFALFLFETTTRQRPNGINGTKRAAPAALFPQKRAKTVIGSEPGTGDLPPALGHSGTFGKIRKHVSGFAAPPATVAVFVRILVPVRRFSPGPFGVSPAPALHLQKERGPFPQKVGQPLLSQPYRALPPTRLLGQQVDVPNDGLQWKERLL
jgi:hypothetical protein